MAGKVLDFWSFLNEAKGETTKVIVLTGNTQGSKTSKSFAEQCEKRGVECYVVDVNQVMIEMVVIFYLSTIKQIKLKKIIWQDMRYSILKKLVVKDQVIS
jgi:hypothetical protein